MTRETPTLHPYKVCPRCKEKQIQKCYKCKKDVCLRCDWRSMECIDEQRILCKECKK